MQIHHFLLVAVGDHDQVEVSTCGNHLVEGAELIEAQRTLDLICVCFLQMITKTVVGENRGRMCDFRQRSRLCVTKIIHKMHTRLVDKTSLCT